MYTLEEMGSALSTVGLFFSLYCTFIKTERTSMAQTVMHAGADQEGEQQAEETRGIQQYLLKAVLNNTLKVTARDGSTR